MAERRSAPRTLKVPERDIPPGSPSLLPIFQFWKQRFDKIKLIMSKAEELAKIVWGYHSLNQQIKQSNCIIALGNSDLRTAQKAAEVFNNGYADSLVVTGGFGRLTKDKFSKPEALVFAGEAERLGVPKDKILIEDKSTNTFDNARLTKKLLNDKNIHPKSIVIVTKPYMERRAYETFVAVLPSTSIAVTSPDLDFNNYPNNAVPMDLLINMVVGDHQRLMIFSDSGDIAKQEVPEDVMSAYKKLISLGYNKQLIPEENIPSLLATVRSGRKS